jgi:hypothetical protein
MPNNAISQFLARITELKRNLVNCEADCRSIERTENPQTAAMRMQSIKREIAEYERAITALIPRGQSA